jgi:hypothetical protein
MPSSFTVGDDVGDTVAQPCITNSAGKTAQKALNLLSELNIVKIGCNGFTLLID